MGNIDYFFLGLLGIVSGLIGIAAAFPELVSNYRAIIVAIFQYSILGISVLMILLGILLLLLAIFNKGGNDAS